MGAIVRVLLAGLIFAVAAAFGQPASALVTAQLNLDNNGTVIVDPNQIVDVTADDAGANPWSVRYGDGLNFEQAFFNYDQPLTAGDVQLTGASIGQWVPDTNGGTAGNFGQFSFAWDGPNPAGLSELTFEILVAGNFVPNSKGNTFAAKISSEQGGNAGGFVSDGEGSVSTVPIPGAVWLFLSALAGLGIMSRRHINPQGHSQA